MAFFDTLADIHPKTPTEWRAWLEVHHADAPGVWVIYFRASTGKRELSWEQAVREALCFGWIDSKVQSIDDERYRQVFTPRKPKSVWSKVNKDHVADLERAGRMQPAGLAAVEVARRNGAWAFLEPIDALVEPEALARALEASPDARAAYDGLSTSAKRQVLYRLYAAKREATRAKRLDAVMAELLG